MSELVDQSVALGMCRAKHNRFEPRPTHNFYHHRVLGEFAFPFCWLVIRSLWICENRPRSLKRTSPSSKSTESHSLAHPTRIRRLHSVWECISVAARGAGWRCAYQCDSVISSMMAVVPAAWQRCDKKRLTLTLPLYWTNALLCIPRDYNTLSGLWEKKTPEVLRVLKFESGYSLKWLVTLLSTSINVHS